MNAARVERNVGLDSFEETLKARIDATTLGESVEMDVVLVSQHGLYYISVC